MISTKPKVLLVVPNLHQAIGIMAKYIAEPATDVDFYYFSSNDIKRQLKHFMFYVNRVDVVHWLSNIGLIDFPTGFGIQQLPVPSIATVHHIDRSAGKLADEEIKLGEASKSNIIHVYATEWKAKVAKETTTPVLLAPQLINSKMFEINRSVIRPRRPFRIGSFGFSADFKGRKRLDLLMDALIILKKHSFDFELVVQGPFWGSFQPIFNKNGIRVKNLGYVPSWAIPNSYKYIDLYVCSSDVEGGPLPVLESLASGVPVVSTPVGMALDALSFGGGILFQKGDPKELASIIARIISDPILYKRLSDEAVEVARKFTWEEAGRDYLTMYQYAIQINGTTNSYGIGTIDPRLQRKVQVSIDLIRERRYLWTFLKQKISLSN